MGKLQVNGDLLLAAGDEDRFLTFNYTGGTGYDWRIGYLGSGSGNENFLVFQSDKEGSTFYNALKFGLTTLNAEFGGTVTASSFIGNLSGTATHATYLNTVAGNEIRIHNATGLTNGGSLWLGWAWADGNKTVTKDWYIGNFSGGGLANIYASTFNGSLNGNATSASSAPWSGITGKPSTFTPSSHTHNYIEPKGIYTFTSSTLPNSFDLGISCGFVDHNAGFGNYGSVLTIRTYSSGGGGTLQFYAPYSPTYGGTHLKARFGNYDSNTGNSWTSLKEIAWLSDLTWSNISGKPSTFTPSSHSHNTLDNISATDEASYSSTQRYIFMAYNDLTTNRPAYDTRLTFQTSTGTLSAPIFKGSLSGNATSATSASSASWATQAGSVYGPYSGNGGNQIPSYIGTNTTRFAMMRNFGGSDIGGYMDCILMNNYSWSDVPYATGLGITKVNGYPRAIIANGPKTGWAYATELVTTYNYSWWCVPLSGGTMTGNLSINTHGNILTIGSLNESWCHFESSAVRPFYFNRTTFVDGAIGIYQMNSQGCGSSFPSSPSTGQIFFKI